LLNVGDEAVAEPQTLLGGEATSAAIVCDAAEPATDTATNRAASTWLVQFARYLVVGGFSFLVDFAVMVALKELVGVGYLTAASIGFVFGLVMNYVLSVTWVFDSRSVSNRGFEFLVFTAVGLCGLGLNELIMFVGVTNWAFDYRLVKIVAVALLLVWNFGVRKLLLFSKVPA